MRSFWLAIALLSACITAHAGELDRLSWLAGHWVSPDGAAEEVWLEPKGGSMAGSFRWVFPNGKQVLEYLVIEETESEVIFRFKHYETSFQPWEKDEPNTYRMAELTDSRVLFVRISGNDKVPARYSYEREGDTLTFRGEGKPGDEPLVLTFRLR